MDFSDDEADDATQFVDNFHFVDDRNEPISFCNLPICWTGDENPESLEKQFFLQGTADGGRQAIYKPVTSWKFELLDKEPCILVLSKEKRWIQLQKPRKSYEPTIRTILITLNALHFLKRNPDALGQPFWDQLRILFSLHEVKPSEIDLIDHIALITDAVKHDETLSQSKFLQALLENPAMARASNGHDVHTASEANKSNFIVDDDEELDGTVGHDVLTASEANKSNYIVDDDEELDGAVGDEDDQETYLFDSVCNGGEILCCEGRCLRSFHATVHDGEESDCRSLGFSKAQVEAIQNILCKNCKHKQHQCYICGILGSSDKEKDAERGMTALEIAAKYDNCESVEILFPVTSRIPAYPNWTTGGLMDRVHTEAARKKKKALIAYWTMVTSEDYIDGKGSTITVNFYDSGVVLGSDGCMYVRKMQGGDNAKYAAIDSVPMDSYYDNLRKKLNEQGYLIDEVQEQILHDLTQDRVNYVKTSDIASKICHFNSLDHGRRPVIGVGTGSSKLFFDVVLKLLELEDEREITVGDCIRIAQETEREEEHVAAGHECTYYFAGEEDGRLRVVHVGVNFVQDKTRVHADGAGCSFAYMVLDRHYRDDMIEIQARQRSAEALEAASICRSSGGKCQFMSLNTKDWSVSFKTRPLWPIIQSDNAPGEQF